MKRKYRVDINDSFICDTGEKLFRIYRLEDGLRGGYIGSENNLSHEGTCWVHAGSIVCGDAFVRDDASIEFSSLYDKTTVRDNAVINGSTLRGESFVGESSYIRNSNIVNSFFECEEINYSEVRDSTIRGAETILRNMKVKDSTILCNGYYRGNKIYSSDDFMIFNMKKGYWGYIAFYFNSGNGLTVNRGYDNLTRNELNNLMKDAECGVEVAAYVKLAKTKYIKKYGNSLQKFFLCFGIVLWI